MQKKGGVTLVKAVIKGEITSTPKKKGCYFSFSVKSGRDIVTCLTSVNLEKEGLTKGEKIFILGNYSTKNAIFSCVQVYKYYNNSPILVNASNPFIVAESKQMQPITRKKKNKKGSYDIPQAVESGRVKSFDIKVPILDSDSFITKTKPIPKSEQVTSVVTSVKPITEENNDVSETTDMEPTETTEVEEVTTPVVIPDIPSLDDLDEIEESTVENSPKVEVTETVSTQSSIIKEETVPEEVSVDNFELDDELDEDLGLPIPKNAFEKSPISPKATPGIEESIKVSSPIVSTPKEEVTQSVTVKKTETPTPKKRRPVVMTPPLKAGGNLTF